VPWADELTQFMCRLSRDSFTLIIMRRAVRLRH